MKKLKTLAILSLAGLLTLAAPAMSADAAWKKTSAGKMYTQTASPGYVTGLKKIGNYYYYFNKKGIMLTGFLKIDGKLNYFLKSNGRRYKGWVTANKAKYYMGSDYAMVTGLQKIGNYYYYFANNGKLQKGWVKTSAGYYFANTKNGKLACSQWVGNYYFDENCLMVTNQWVDGKWLGANGKFNGVYNNVGWVTRSGKTYYYDSNCKMVKGWLSLKGKTYYLNKSTGILQKGWITIGSSKYYADSSGVIAKSKWVNNKYLKSNGVMATGLTQIGGKTYYFNSSGVKQTGWITIGKQKYYFNSNGVMQTSTWIDKRYVNSSGVMATGFTQIGSNTYYFNPSTGVKMTGWLVSGGNKYYLLKSTGVLQKNKWLWSTKYYAGSTGAILKGLNAIGSNIYYFDPTTGLKAKRTLKTVGNDIYYFCANGAALKNSWGKVNGKYYYFQSTGKAAKSTWVGKYYLGADGVRDDSKTRTTGWQTVSGVKYYFDSNYKMLTGLQTISGSTYYFNSSGAMQTGIQTVNGKKYYFYSDGKMAYSITIIIGTKQYTINSSGVITNEESIKISGTTTGAQIVNYALQYVGNPYVYGGTSLTNGADCSGFVQTIFSKFGYKLLRVANDQMYGPTTSYINNYGYTKAVVVDISSIQPGDLLFYGSGNYASHVAIYMGNGQIVHASNSQPYPKGGIKVSNYDYQTPLKAVRYWS